MEFVALIFGWWLPGIVFYLLGLCGIIVLWTSRDWRPVALWLAAFLPLQAYVLWNGIVQQADFKSRAARFPTIVTYSPPPAEVRTIVIAADDERPPHLRVDPIKDRPPGLTGDEQNCATVCLQMLFGGRFDRVIVRNQAPRVQSDRFRIYQLVMQPGCRFFVGAPPYVQSNLRLWQATGRCVTEQRVAELTGPRFEVFTDSDVPELRSWHQHVTYVRLAGTDRDRDIARAENGFAAFAVLAPWPGVFPWQRQASGHGWSADVLRGDFQSYGPDLTATNVLERLFGLAVPSHQDKLPKPPV